MQGKRKKKTVISTGVVVAHCQVSYDTVKNWIHMGKLPAYATPGRRHLIRLEDFHTFLKTYGMPPYEGAESRKRKLLVVDDEADLVKAICAFFERTGQYACASAVDGFEAGMQVMRFGPDVVILDLIIPRLNGIEVCRKIKTIPDTQHILVLAITGHPEDRNVEKVLEAGADAYLMKPFTLETLKQQVEQVFEEHRRTSQARRKERHTVPSDDRRDDGDHQHRSLPRLLA